MENILIIANGSIDPKLWAARINPYPLVICADGGTRFALENGITPHLVVGDLDSLEKKYQDILFSGNFNLDIHPMEKDASDFEIALERALEYHPSSVVVMGGWGTRWDHSLINLHLLSRFTTPALTIKMVDRFNTAQVVVPGKTLDIRGSQGDCLSLIPLSPSVKGVHSRGLSYPLKGRDLAFGTSLPVSNSLNEDRVRVSIEEGSLLVIHHYDKYIVNYDL